MTGLDAPHLDSPQQSIHGLLAPFLEYGEQQSSASRRHSA